MTTLPQKRFGDPLDVLLKAEAETCKGCIYREVWLYAKPSCGNPEVKQVLADKRCDEYEEQEK